MKTLFIFVILLTWCNFSYSQKKEIEGYVYDNVTGKPIKYAAINTYMRGLYLTNEKGCFKIPAKKKIDTLSVYHIKYGSVKVPVDSNRVVVGMDEFEYHLGILNLNDCEYLRDIDCNSNKTKPKRDDSEKAQDHARFKGGLVCLDKIIWNGLIQVDLLDEITKSNRVTVSFEVNEIGEVENVRVKSKLDAEAVDKIKIIFYNSPVWDPAYQLNDKVSTNYKYMIKK